MARTIALYNFCPWVILLMCVLVAVLVVSFGTLLTALEIGVFLDLLKLFRFLP